MRAQLNRWLRRFVVGCVVLAAVPLAARAQPKVNTDPIEAPEVRKLVFRGVEKVDVLDLERSIRTEAGECVSVFLWAFCRFWHSSAFFEKKFLDRSELAIDMRRIRAYYWMRGYRSAEVDTTITPLEEKKVMVTFDVREGPPTLVSRIRIDYDSTLLPARRIARNTLLRAGEPLDLVKLDSMRVLFANEMWAEGHSDATVDTVVTVDRARRVADVHLRLIPNHATVVGDIVITGLEKVDRQTVLNAITLKPGDPYRQGDVLASQRNLFESNLFRLAIVDVPPQFDSVKQVNISLSESPLRETSAGVGVSNIEFFKTDAKFTSYNLLGGARRLDVNVTAGNIGANQLAGRGFFYDPGEHIAGGDAGKFLQPTWAASVDFRQPAFLQRPTTQAGFTAFAHRRSTPGIFIDRGYGGSATITNHVRVRAPVSATYRYELNRVDAGDVYFCVNYGVCEIKTIEALRAHQRLSPLSITGFIDRSDEPLDPTRGYLARAELEHASRLTISDYGYSRAYLDVAAYNHHGLTHVYAGHLRLGLVRAGGGDVPVYHPRKLLYAGGASSVRGFATNQLGPRVLTISPEKLTDPNREAAACSPGSITDGTCDAAGLDSKEFNPQPLGGTSLLEGSVEYRIPIAMARRLWVAAFIDGAVVGSDNSRIVGGEGFSPLTTLRSIAKGSWAITPGVGIRYKSPVGPIRVDVGFNPARTESLEVVTETIIDGQRRIVSLGPRFAYTSAKTLLDRFTLHFSIGQAY